MSNLEPVSQDVQPDLQTPPDPAQKRAKRVFMGFAATMIVGLTMAGWYLGSRMFTAERVQAATPAKPNPAAPPVAKAAPVALSPLAAEAVPVDTKPVAIETKPVAVQPANATPAWNTINPQEGELYLQLAAMGPNSTNDYLKILDAKGIHPKIAPGPTDHLHRILVGPYPDKAALESQQRELESAGLEFMARRY